MKVIKLTNGKETIVDNRYYDWLKKYQWYYINGYAMGRIDNKVIYMHRAILKAFLGEECDHINGDRLDNRRENLRLCTHVENIANRGKHKNNKTGHKGIQWDSRWRKWRARSKRNGEPLFDRGFENIEDAISFYREEILKHDKEFARF